MSGRRRSNPVGSHALAAIFREEIRRPDFVQRSVAPAAILANAAMWSRLRRLGPLTFRKLALEAALTQIGNDTDLVKTWTRPLAQKDVDAWASETTSRLMAQCQKIRSTERKAPNVVWLKALAADGRKRPALAADDGTGGDNDVDDNADSEGGEEEPRESDELIEVAAAGPRPDFAYGFDPDSRRAWRQALATRPGGGKQRKEWTTSWATQ